MALAGFVVADFITGTWVACKEKNISSQMGAKGSIKKRRIRHGKYIPNFLCGISWRNSRERRG
ncbi:phage holin family protein [Acetonema longum]|uniref:phage holin family protein n=1 Tax=Acetonema longum TaxID=2374 RepID=UPI00030DA558